MNNNGTWIVSHNYSTGDVAEDTILYYLRETAACHNYAASAILIDYIFIYLRRAIEHGYSVVVVVDTVPFNPAEAAFDHKYALSSAFVNIVVIYHGVIGTFTTKGYISFKVCVNLVLFYVTTCTLDQEYTLCKISKDFILNDYDGSLLQSLDACFSIWGDWWFLYSSKVVSSSAYDSIVFIHFNVVKFDSWVTSEIILSNCHYSVFNILLNMIHKNNWIGWNDLDAVQTVINFAALYLWSVSSVDSDTYTIDMVNLSAQNNLFTLYSL